MTNDNKWDKAPPSEFWGELAPCDHVLQIYESEETFISTLAGFVRDGIDSGDCTILIATEQHLTSLELVLCDQGLDIDPLKKAGLYRPLDAETALSNFMVDGWPDSDKFHAYISRLFRDAKRNGRNVRAFGEMVALLWAQGNNGATVQLEHLWNEFCKTSDLTLFCAYPKSGFTDTPDSSIQHICRAHSKIISGQRSSGNMISYKTTAEV